MKTIELHGILRKKFGRFFKLDVQSAKEACHAIGCQIPAFRQLLAESEKLGYRFAVFNGKKRNQRINISENQLDDTTTANHIHIVPRVVGSGGKAMAVLSRQSHRAIPYQSYTVSERWADLSHRQGFIRRIKRDYWCCAIYSSNASLMRV